MSDSGGMLIELAARVGALAFVSEQLFELEGRWSVTMESPAATVHLATHSRHHGWHAGLWREALPDSLALDPASLVRPPSPAWSAAVAACASFDDSSDTVRLAALYRGVIPRVVGLVDELADRLGGPGDAHLARVAGLVKPDVVDDWRGGHALLTVAMAQVDEIEMAAETSKVLDRAFRTC